MLSVQNKNDGSFKGHIERIDSIAHEIKEISSSINMVAINSAIQSANASSGVNMLSESIMDTMMTVQCKMLAELMKVEANRNNTYIAFLCEWAKIDNVFITDADGVIVLTNDTHTMGWRFPDDPKDQAAVFRSLLKQPDQVVCQRMQHRSFDGQMFKYVGISRCDSQGIIQVGMKSDMVLRYQTEIGKVFSVMAEEIRKLSTDVAAAAKEIAETTRVIKQSP